jgi:hypothetical protein
VHRELTPHALLELTVHAFHESVFLWVEVEPSDVAALHAYDLVPSKDPSFNEVGMLVFPDEVLQLLYLKDLLAIGQGALELAIFFGVEHAVEVVLDASSTEEVFAG